MSTRPATPPHGHPALRERYTYAELFLRVGAQYVVLATSNKTRTDMGHDLPIRDRIDEIKFRQIADLIDLIDQTPALKAHIREAASQRRRSLEASLAAALDHSDHETGDDDACDA